MPAFQLSQKAVQDLYEIGQYTQEHWGKDQRIAYFDRMNRAFSRLAKTPERGRSAQHIRAGYHCYPVEKHIIFYQIKDDTILIIRILHQSMDLPRHLIN
ncbi:MAG: type II toxin-antitoxin system RelE/ParE family toxin [Pseudomonadota bacterium]